MLKKPDQIEGTKEAGEQIAEEAKKQLKDAEGKLNFGVLFQELKIVFDALRKGEGKEAFKKATEIITAIFSTKLSNLKADVEKTRQEKKREKKEENDTTEKSDEEKEEVTKQSEEAPESETPQEIKPSTPAAKIDMSEFAQGSLTAALSKYAEVLGGLKPLQTVISKPRKGKSNWPKTKTDNWDYEKAGNTDEDMAKGLYRIESVSAPAGYTRQVAGKVPNESTRKKLTQIAVALRTDNRMPLFKGITLKVDGIEVMMVKEIHMTDEYPLPHTGISYIVKA
ncbi:hypothetical protein JXD20_02975 [Candidatus Peregrinibacteria bacterium]|nr:hypothetical protein [Candidatus Peregrinibacteria bacterium]